MKNNDTKWLGLGLAILVSSTTVSLLGHSDGSKPFGYFVKPPNIAEWVAIPTTRTMCLSFIIASFWRLYSKHPNVNFESRFSRNQLLQVNKVLTKKYWENVYYLWEDEIVGQCHKGKSTKIGKEGSEDRLQIREKEAYPQGLCGLIDSYVIATGWKTMEKVGSLLLFYHLISQYGLHAPAELKTKKGFGVNLHLNI